MNIEVDINDFEKEKEKIDKKMYALKNKSENLKFKIESFDKFLKSQKQV